MIHEERPGAADRAAASGALDLVNDGHLVAQSANHLGIRREPDCDSGFRAN
jgi:hypothetical protein